MHRLILLFALVTVNAFGMLMTHDISSYEGAHEIDALHLGLRDKPIPAGDLARFTHLTVLHISKNSFEAISVDALALGTLAKLQQLTLQSQQPLNLPYSFIAYCARRGLRVDLSYIQVDEDTAARIYQHGKNLFTLTIQK